MDGTRHMLEFLFLVVLIVLNGFFAMSELAVVSARRGRLEDLRERGHNNAQYAINLAGDPNRFLATVQVGISLIGILAGAFGGATLAGRLEPLFENIGLAPYSETLAFGSIVLLTTYLSLVIGELVPKRLALRYPEGISLVVARPMMWLAKATIPITLLLESSTDLIVNILPLRRAPNDHISEKEVLHMVRQGIQAGVFDETEEELVEGVMRLDEYRITEVMIPRTELVWLDNTAELSQNQQVILTYTYSFYPVCDEKLDNITGVVRTKDILKAIANGKDYQLAPLMQKPLFLPETLHATDALAALRDAKSRVGFVIDEYGGLEGMVTTKDILFAIVDDLAIDTPKITQRADGSWLVDARLPIARLQEAFPVMDLPAPTARRYATLAGYMLAKFTYVPQVADSFEADGLRFEVVDTDGGRIDQVLIEKISSKSVD